MHDRSDTASLVQKWRYGIYGQQQLFRANLFMILSAIGVISMQQAIPAPPVSKGIRPFFAYVSLGLLFFALMMREIGVYDIWFLLLAGRYTLEHLAVPHQEFYLYTALNEPQLFGGWGYGVIAELVRRAGGVAAICYFNAALWSGVFLLGLAAVRASTLELCRRISWSEIVSFLFSAVIILLAIISRTLIRPEVTAFIAWMCGLLLFETCRRKGDFKRALFAYPIVLWIEAWLHTAGPILVLLPAAYAAEHFYQRHIVHGHKFSQLKPDIIAWGTSGLVMLVLPCFNPNGVAQVYTHLAFLLEQLHDLAQSGPSTLTSVAAGDNTFNIEYLPAWEIPQLQPVYFMLGIATVALFVTRPRRLYTFCLIMPLAVFAVLHNRGLGLWGLALLVPLAGMFEEIWRDSFGRVSRDTQDVIAASLLPFFIFTLFGVCLWKQALKPASTSIPLTLAAEEIRHAYPEGGNVFTEQHLGALAAWNLGDKYKVAHGTHIMFPHPEPQRHYVAVMQAKQGWEKELERYKVIAIIAKADDPFFGDPHPVMRKIAYDKNWQLVNVAPEALTYIRVSPGMPAESDADRVLALQAFWETVQRDATKIASNLAFIRTKKALEQSRVKLAIIKDNAADPAAALQKLMMEEQATATK